MQKAQRASRLARCDGEIGKIDRRTLANGRIPLATPPELHTPISVMGNVGWSYGVGGHTH